MSKLVAFAAIQGAYNIVSKAEGKYKRALETYGGSQKLEFPNTAYFLPIIYSLTGIKVKDLDSARKPLDFARKLIKRLGLERIVAVADRENKGSWRIMEKCGMQFEKIGQFYGMELLMYSISKHEFSSLEK